jgi:hypothetical protein
MIIWNGRPKWITKPNLHRPFTADVVKWLHPLFRDLYDVTTLVGSFILPLCYVTATNAPLV